MGFGTNADPATIDPTANASFMSFVKGILQQLVANGTVTLTGADIQIGATENKDGETDARGKVRATGSIAEGDIVVGVQAPVLGITTAAAVVTDAAGTLQQYLRGLVKLFAARIPASLGSKADANALPVTQSTEDKAVLAAIAADIAQLNNQPHSAAKLVDALALTTTADESSQLSTGHYLIASDVDCYILQADSDAGTDLATYADGHLMLAGYKLIQVTGATDDYLAALVRAGSGVLTISGPY
jgi:hypothetical protein